MRCPNCERELVPVLLSVACDYCDFGVPSEKLHRGYIVLRSDPPFEDYVFRTRMDADRWRQAVNCGGFAIYSVYSLTPYHWHMSRGTLQNIVLADHLFEVFASHRYAPRPHRCFLGEKVVEHEEVPDCLDDDDIPF